MDNMRCCTMSKLGSTMATALLSPPCFPLCSLLSSSKNHCQISRSNGKNQSSKKANLVVYSSQVPNSRNSLLRRDLLLFGLFSHPAVFFPSSDLLAEVELNEDVKMGLLVDDINAYSFQFPMELPKKKFSFKWVESRKPERYSSAAPLSPNARQRIVSERVDMIHNLVISVSVGPPNSRLLTSKDKNTWNAKDVADSVLSDKSALPVATSQRMVESSVLDAHSSIVDGEPYWYYEYIVRKSPTPTVQESNLYRHNLSATAERDGYLYSLNASTLSKQWEFMGPYLENTVASFRLLPPTDNYVPPYKDPWRFW
ncbi:Photosystem II protein [Dioscorea alata]|uniref:Photosystem II protein n=1 Tax=Dioscorea alata TaxID=55571 RepID=A0ACB7TVD8_DIOAL|nr:Photosystem II protein [Dioscorea alata]